MLVDDFQGPGEDLLLLFQPSEVQLHYPGGQKRADSLGSRRESNAQNYRPDIEYIQGMSYVMIFLLLFATPFKAFKIFANMILGSNFILKAFIFKKDHITKISQSSKKLIQKFHTKIYKFCVKLNVDLWEVFLIEVSRGPTPNRSGFTRFFCGRLQSRRLWCFGTFCFFGEKSCFFSCSWPFFRCSKRI